MNRIAARSLWGSCLLWPLFGTLGCGGGDDIPAADGASADGAALLDAGVDGGTSTSSFEPPISLVFKIHIEPQSGVGQYRIRRDNVEAVRLIAEQYGSKLTIHGNGEFWQYAAEEGNAPLVQSWIDAGHDVGLHMHSVYQEPNGSHPWRTASTMQTSNQTFVSDLWQDHERNLAALLPNFQITQATPFNSDDATFVAQMQSAGYLINGGGRHEIVEAWIGQEPHFPFRMGPRFLEEDLSSPILMVHHRPQIGDADFHGPPGQAAYQDATLPHIKAQWIELYLNRLYAERSGDPNDRVWMFGILTHDNRSDAAMRTQVNELLNWIVTRYGGGKRSLRGNPLLKFGTFSSVRSDYLAWESAHPGVSSYHMATPTPVSPQRPTEISEAESKRVYRGRFWGLAHLLRATEMSVCDYVQDVELFSSAGVSVAEFSVGSRTDMSRRAKRWVAWKESDGDATIDVGSLVGAAQVRLRSIVDKTPSEIAASAVVIGAEPVVFERTDSPL